MAAAFPTEINHIKGRGMVRIPWDDGHAGEYEQEYLRGYCPCALCQGHGAQRRFINVPARSSKACEASVTMRSKCVGKMATAPAFILSTICVRFVRAATALHEMTTTFERTALPSEFFDSTSLVRQTIIKVLWTAGVSGEFMALLSWHYGSDLRCGILVGLRLTYHWVIPTLPF